MKKLLPLLLLMFFVVSACQKEPDITDIPNVPQVDDQVLVNHEFIGNYSRNAIRTRLNYGNIPQRAIYNINVYKITYKTRLSDGTEIQASGAVLVPDVDSIFPLLSHQHGTILLDNHAPSYFNSNSEAWSLGAVLASAGYIVSAPDYIGYGASNTFNHPYEVASLLASASADMLLAVKEFCKKENILLNDKVFLTGYSEGGKATMALHKHLEENHTANLNVTASAPGAGAYNKSEFARYILSSDKSLQFLNFYLWVLQSYYEEYQLDGHFSHNLKEPHASNVKNNGPFTSINYFPKQLFTDEFREGVLNGTNTKILEVFSINDRFDWKPVAPLMLIHGTSDDFVPFFNAQTAYDAMKIKGGNVVLKAVSGDHSSAYGPYCVELFQFFDGFN